MRILMTLVALVGLIPVALSGAEPVDPTARANESWISISGTVVAPTSDSFTLDYGKGTILVEMDDWDSVGEAHGLLDGYKVIVNGRIDDDLYEMAKIEAGSVYVKNLNTYFYASSADEEDSGSFWHFSDDRDEGKTHVRGTVTSVDPAARSFTVDTDKRLLTVTTGLMAYDPLDDKGFQQIDVGDEVSIWGFLDEDFLSGRTIRARSVVTLQNGGGE